MTVTVAEGDVERFRQVLARVLGLRFDETGNGALADVLRRRLEATGGAPGDYLERLDHERAGIEIDALAAELTIPETYFFRHHEQFDAFTSRVLRDRSGHTRATGRLRFLSAGCATGEEAYTLAILLAEHVGLRDQPAVLAVDVNPVALERARRARYSTWALRETPPDSRRRWFHVKGRDAVLDDRIRAAVRFERRNLSEPDAALWAPEVYDAVFCRNVLMYLTPEVARAVVERIAASLVPGGHLFLGHAETLRGLSTAFDLCHDHGTFYYRRTPELCGPAETDGQPLVDLVEEAGAWVDAVRLATGRVAELTGAAGTRETIPRWDLGRPLALLRQERFGEALEAVEALPPVAAGDADVLLLHAALLTHGGQLERAEDACGRLLDLDPLSAGAHYLLALCREAVGDLEAAVECDRLAVHLDPGFAMPRVHLGLLARRVGDTASVHDEMAHAVTALQDEDASRLLIFGGGFTREALAALCRAEMAAVGASP